LENKTLEKEKKLEKKGGCLFR